MTIIAPLHENRTCPECRQSRHISEYRLYRRGGTKRHRECRLCYNRQMRERKRRVQYESLRNAIRPLAWKSARASITDQVVGELVNSYGGIDAFVAAWREAIDYAKQNGEVQFALQSYQVVLATLAQNQMYCDRINFNRMSEAETKEFLLGHLADQLVKHPEIILAAARQQGWYVKPPKAASKAK